MLCAPPPSTRSAGMYGVFRLHSPHSTLPIQYVTYPSDTRHLLTRLAIIKALETHRQRSSPYSTKEWAIAVEIHFEIRLHAQAYGSRSRNYRKRDKGREKRMEEASEKSIPCVLYLSTLPRDPAFTAHVLRLREWGGYTYRLGRVRAGQHHVCVLLGPSWRVADATPRVCDGTS